MCKRADGFYCLKKVLKLSYSKEKMHTLLSLDSISEEFSLHKEKKEKALHYNAAGNF
jgi:hypothetical protein